MLRNQWRKRGLLGFGRPSSMRRRSSRRGAPRPELLETRALLALTLTSITRETPSGQFTNDTQVTFQATFNEAAQGVDTNVADFALAGTATAGASITTPFTTDGGVNWLIPVIGVSNTANGTLGLNLVSNAGITNALSEPLTTTTLAGAAFTLDHVRPTVVSLDRTSPVGSPTNSTTLTYTAVFSESVSGVDATDFQIATIGGTSVSNPLQIAGSGSSYTVTVSVISGNGTVQVNLVDDSSIRDLAGNSLGALNAPAGFTAAQNVATGRSPVSVAAADVNGDGRLDLMATNSSYLSANVSVLLGNGNGTFAAAQNFPSGGYPNGLAVGDVNGDGRVDLILANYNPTVSVLLGNGNGTFGAPQNFATGDQPGFPVLVDLNSDGRVDIVLTNFVSGDVSVLLGNGDGTFASAQNFSTGQQPGGVAIDDFNGDGRPDLAVANYHYTSANVSILLGNGNGTFAPAQNFASGGQPLGLAVGDVNADGDKDIVVANRTNGSVSVLLGAGDGTFAAPQNFVVGNRPYTLILADLNGDSRLDLAAANFNDNTISVLVGNGNGTFAAAQNFPTGNSPLTIAHGDVNGDGRADLLVTNLTSNTVSVLLADQDVNFTGQVTTVNTVPPTVTDARIAIATTGAGPGGVYRIGNTLTVQWDNTASGDNNPDIASVTVDFSAFGGGSAVAATNSAGIWTASYTIVPGSIDAANLHASLTATDGLGNFTTQADSTNVSLDNIVPTVTDAEISIVSVGSGAGGAYIIGDTVTVSWDNSAAGDNNADIETVVVDFSSLGGSSSVVATGVAGVFSASYVVAGGTIDAAALTVVLTATDDAGNATVVADSTLITLDNQSTTVTDAEITIVSTGSGAGGVFVVGDIVTVQWDNSATGDNNLDVVSTLVDFSQLGGGSGVTASNASGVWTASFTLAAGSIDGTALAVSLVVTDDAGNITTTVDTALLVVDSVRPLVTAGEITITGSGSGTGGAYIIGDTVVARWDNAATGDNNPDIAGVTVNFAQFGGGSAVAATNAAGIWTASYVIAAGNIDAGNRNVSVTATDDGGNATTTTDTASLTVDNHAPVVTDARINITSTGSGAGGTYVAGDVVTARWNNSAAGDNNPDVVSVTMNFTAFGGGSAMTATNASGNWTASYTIAAGSIHSGNRNVSVTATDNAGNSSTTTDTSNLIVDNRNVAPIAIPAGVTAVTLKFQGGQFVLVASATNQVIATRSPALPVVIQGNANSDNTLSLDLSGIGSLTGGTIVFHGGTGTGIENTINVINGSFIGSVYNYTGAHVGSLVVGTGAGTLSIQYDHLTPLSNLGDSTNSTFNLPSGVVASLDPVDGTTSRLQSRNGTFEVTTFENPSGALALNVGANSSVVVSSSLNTATSAEFTAGGDNVIFQTQASQQTVQSFSTPVGSVGEVLIVDVTRRTNIALATTTPGNGQLTFGNAQSVAFTDFDSVWQVERLFRTYNDNAGQHFYTNDAGEFDVLISLGLSDETTGQAGFTVLRQQAAGSLPVHRFYNPNAGQHYYTISDEEADMLRAEGWDEEGNSGFLFATQQPGTVEILHLYNNVTGEHIFTEAPNYLAALQAQTPDVWEVHGSLGFGVKVTADELPAPTPVSSPMSSAPLLALATAGASEDSGTSPATTTELPPMSVASGTFLLPVSNEAPADSSVTPPVAAQDSELDVGALDDFWSAFSAELDPGLRQSSV